MFLLRLQSFVELSARVRETANVPDAVTLTDGDVARVAVRLQDALEVFEQTPGDSTGSCRLVVEKNDGLVGCAAATR